MSYGETFRRETLRVVHSRLAIARVYHRSRYSPIGAERKHERSPAAIRRRHSPHQVPHEPQAEHELREAVHRAQR